jgi:EAL domain-containing protein (putative c-di-GMP-specific phosphodiesterase class I)/PAS domain-containing protein
MEVICRFMRMRLNADRPVVTVSLNVSPVEMTMPGFLDSYISIKEKYEIPDDLIELEFTEGIFFENEKLFKDTITTLKSHGFSCSLDDFGSGYSSLNVLKEMPVDVLKLDKLFFKESGDITRDRSVIRSVVAMARSLNIKTVAEGVETLDTVEFLKLIGCTMIQGYVFARPMPLTEFEQLMDNETISTLGASDLGLDKYSEIIPLDKPYDLSIRQSYQMIFEINTNGDLYHVYKQDGCKLKAEALPERGSYHSLIGKYLPAVIHPSDIRRVSDVLAPASLKKYFESSRELDLEYREITLDSQYIWVKLHIIRAQGTQLNNLILFGYISDINDVKRQEESLLATESRFSSAFIGISGIVGEYDFTTGKVIVLEKTNSTLSILNKINDYDTIVQFGAENLVHKEHVNRLLDTCSTEKIKEAFLVKKEKTLSIKILARPSRKVDFYNWYEITYYMQPNNPNKLLVTVQDITSREKEEFNEKTLLDMNRLALCKTFDEIMEIDLNNDTYKLTLIVNKEDGEERVSEGKYSTLFEAMCKYLFPPDDTELMDSLLSINALRSFYKDSELSEMSTNIRRHEKFSASGEDPYLWYNIMILAANKNLEYADPVVYVYIKNIQAEKTSEHELLDYVRRLSRSVSLYLYVYEFSIDERTVTVLGGKNVAGDVSTLKNIPYSEYIDSLADEAVAEEDRTIFEELCEPETLKSYFETEGDEFSCSVRSRKNKGSSLKITQLFDSRERIVTVLISEMN